MAPLPENNTPVVFIRYTSGGQAHELPVRLPATATAGTALTAATTMKNAMKGLLYPSDSITGARYRAAGDVVSVPLGLVPAVGTLAGTPDDDLKPNFLSFTGRSADGRDVKATLFTRAVSPASNGWRSLAPNTAELALLNALQDPTVLAKTISGQTPLWNSYVNYGSNSYYQRKARRT